MRTSRVLILILFFALSLVVFCRTLASVAHQPRAKRAKPPTSRSRISSLFASSSGFSLFSPNAAIRLTDDNGTSFPAQPAAFGPGLPHHGLSGQLWIGSGFAEEHYFGDGAVEGELGCGDIPGWQDVVFDLRDPKASSLSASRHDKRMRDFKTPPTPFISATHTQREEGQDAASRHAARSGDSSHVSVPPVQHDIDVTGKIVLLSRGGCGFLEKVLWAQRRGATALIVGDNQRGGPLIQMFAKGDTSNVTIPSVFTTRTTAHLLSSLMQPGSFLAGTVDAFGRRSFIVGHLENPPSEISGSVNDVDGSASEAGQRTQDSIMDLMAQEDRARNDVERTWWQKIFGFTTTIQGDALRRSPDARSLLGVLGRREDLTSRSEASAPHFPSFNPASEDPSYGHTGLWVTITPSEGVNHFFDTLLVLVVSPLITLTIVYTLLVVRAQMRRRRWRAPKSVVEQLPVRTYHTMPRTPSHLSRCPSPITSTPTTPLLQQLHTEDRTLGQSRLPSSSREEASTTDEVEQATSPTLAPAASQPQRQEKPSGGMPSEWKKYMNRQVECVVCLEEYVDGISQVMSLPCGHEFHADCITPWLTTRRRTCPICKGDVVRSLAQGPSSSPRYAPYHDDSEEEIDGHDLGTTESNRDLEQGGHSASSSTLPSRAEAWFGRFTHSFGATSRSVDRQGGGSTTDT